MNTTYTAKRIMARINLIIRTRENSLGDDYYLFLKSSKLWSDINFISTRAFVLDDFSFDIAIGSKGELKILNANVTLEIKKQEEKLTPERVENLVASELFKVFGIQKFKGKLLSDKMEYIEESKRMNEITHYIHYFYRITELPDLNRLIGLDNMELLSVKLMKQISSHSAHLHENYLLSNVIINYIKNNLWKKEKNFYLIPEKTITKKRIAVLFSDIKDFGSIVQQFGREESRSTKELVKRYQHEASLYIKSNGGYVVQTAGDAFMAIFSLSNSEEEEIFQVIQAAISILSIDSIIVNKKKIKIATRIGLNIAEVEEGFLGAPDLREYTVFGKDVNVASRLEKKVDEVSESIENFAGGLLFNIASCRDPLLEEEKRKVENLFTKIENLFLETEHLWLKQGLLESWSTQKKEIHNLATFFNIKSKVEKFIENRFKKLKKKFQIHKNILPIQVKEGDTRCLFIYKTK